MKKIKNIITGILSVAVFFMAVQVGLANESSANSSSIDMNEQLHKTISSFTIQTDTMWFPVTITGLDDEDPEDQSASAEPTNQKPTGECAPENTGPVCAVGLDISGVTDQTAYSALINRINEPSETNPTIQEFLDIGATYLDDAHELSPN